MKRRGRARRVAKWAGLVVCLLIAGVWAVSYWWYDFGYVGARRWGLGFYAGLVLVDVPRPGAVMPAVEYPGWYAWPIPKRKRLCWLPLLYTRPVVELGVPLWMPFVLVGVPTAWLFWRDRGRARPGHCVCGYDLAGLGAGAACPECGAGRGD